MGLDIRAYKNLKETKFPVYDEWGDLDYDVNINFDYDIEITENNFKGRSEGLYKEKIYNWENMYSFTCGSYSGYNNWRSLLKEFSKTLKGNNIFYELIEFSDCEGIIGSVVSKKLYNDFKNNENKAYEYSKKISDGKYWYNKYKEWENAFKIAKENGAVYFC